ncbi:MULTISPECIES: ABC transporter ATP-binding protein [unclassified Actinopolyspora]|uniref:nickel ABC transporter ATP-binding protein NikE n=1 Tax=unclassified Actinopolyspora TaxID=2639451 RepID=UPI0013F628C7|nr:MULTISPECIES: ABC transporter ATP-binding protein [unclassified Actinopolyspora]NHD17655.1 ABC transporter ATP-binding protein [Actinopolyspora sp. BKK2]NHE76612.1 ABC transporter ATP-binding protein [Actinopolyspora sp. BKK1]
MTPVLDMREVSISYRTGGEPRRAVTDVSLSLEAGRTLGLAGESGCGKTTLALSVLRLLPRSARVEGEILLGGRDVGKLTWGGLRAVRWSGASVVFQGAMHALNPVRTVGDQIAEPVRLHSTGRVPAAVLRARVAELLEQVELPVERRAAYPHELSGGQRQRVMIAMALACEPSLIIADEPTTALDVVVQSQILALLRNSVARRDVALLVISHDLSVLANTCGRLAVMYQGELVEQGPAERIVTSPEHRHTRELATAFPTVGDVASRRVGEASSDGGDSSGGVAAPGGALLSARGVSVSFTDGARVRTRAVSDVDLDVCADEIVALVGQSGSGKTTLARALLGLRRPDSGEVSYLGAPLARTGAGLRAFRRRVQLVLQDPTGALNPRHTVYEAVAEGLRVHGDVVNEGERVRGALEAAELRPAEEFLGRFPHELSGGQRQRVVIAGALVLDPGVLVADEPVASLDATVRGEILELLLGLRRQRGLSTLVITHDLGLAWSIADRVAVMRAGEVVERGPVEQVLTAPGHEYTKTLLAAVPVLTRTAT